MESQNLTQAKAYSRKVFDCLGRTWGAHFKAAGIRFTRPTIGFITKPKRFCGSKWGDAGAAYCHESDHFVVLLDKNALEDPSDLYLMHLIGHEYGHHLQDLAGITKAWQYIPYRHRKEELEQWRRLELQADCLGAAFIGSIWDSLDRSAADWDYLLDIMRESGDENSKVKDHGKGRSRAYWVSRGFRAADPGACNTFTAPSSRVA
ncbi:neutral zinc metallopeptidase [Nonomuraea sp. NPDC050328]|uniref:neutral zinc metallopeptidase n=1 Tax=Nonomuraea sp. NPDC050328 TaxID=3364361 RepID=UPI0037AF975A